MPSFRRALSEISLNITSLEWWRDVVFVPYVIGTATRLHPGYPGYDRAVAVMEEEWDNLIILDACRADAFEEMVDVAQFDEYSRTVSLGSHSKEWTRRNFRGKSFGDTVYVSLNPHTTLLANNTFHRLVEVWKDYDTTPNRIDPTVLADAAVETHERHPDKRLIVHFMQPHGTGGLVAEGSSEEEAYYETIEKVADVVTDLAEQLGGRTVITSDHGELFTDGLKRRLGLYKHKARLRFPELVVVPWAVIDGDRRGVTVEDVSRNETDPTTVEQRLQDLGYRS
jgi:hypothetical protein